MMGQIPTHFRPLREVLGAVRVLARPLSLWKLYPRHGWCFESHRIPMKIIRAPILCFAAYALANQAYASPLNQARITKIINDVRVVESAQRHHPASLREVIKDDLAVQTGVKSRSELLFQDDTLTRLGPETIFAFKTGTRDMSLTQGTMLLHVPKGLGGARIRTAAVTAAITGTTIIMEHLSKQHIKVLVLEGSLRLSANGRFGDAVLLRPGQMVVMPPDAKKIPDPVHVDLARVMHTSSLVNMSKPGEISLPSQTLVEQAMRDQTQAIANNSLVPTNTVVIGPSIETRQGSDPVSDTLDKRGHASDVANHGHAYGHDKGHGHGSGDH
jgi:hypothetical protein